MRHEHSRGRLAILTGICVAGMHAFNHRRFQIGSHRAQHRQPQRQAQRLIARRGVNLRHRLRGVVDEGVRFGPRYERAVRAVAAVREPLGHKR